MSHPSLAPLVEVHWIDSIGYDSWRDISEVADKTLGDCYTAGYLIGKTDEMIQIAESMEVSGGETQVADVMCIPAVAVLELIELSRVDDRNNS